jgi:O-antigen/teichoic acid export membrane protein
VAFILVPNAAGTLLTVVIFGSVRVRKPDPIVGEELRALGRPLSFLAVASYALGYADRYVILAMLGPPAVGVYSLGYQLGEGTLEAVSAPLTNALQSRLISEWTDPMAGPSVATATAKRGAAVLLIGSAVAIPGLVLANTLGVLSLISEDHRLVFVAVLVAPAAGIQGITRLSQALLLAERKTRQAMMCFWQVVFLSAITVPLLTRAAGIVGTAVATLLGYSCLAGLTARQALRARNNHAA